MCGRSVVYTSTPAPIPAQHDLCRKSRLSAKKKEEMHRNECQWQFRCKYPNFIRTRNLICAPKEVGAQFSYTLVDVFSFIQQTLFCRIARVAIVRFLGLNRTNSKMNQSNSPFGTEAISNWKRKRNMWRMNWRWNLGGTQHQQWQIWMHRSQKWRAGHHQQCIEIVLYRLFYTNIAIASTIRYAMPMNGSATVWRSRGLEDHFAMITQEFRSSLTLKHQSVSTFLINHPNRHYHCHNHSQQLFSPAMFMKCQAFHVDHS